MQDMQSPLPPRVDLINTNYGEPTYNGRIRIAYIELGKKMDRFLTMYTRMYPNRVKGAREAAAMVEEIETDKLEGIQPQ